jgi:peroxiredoxin Q/BCP
MKKIIAAAALASAIAAGPAWAVLTVGQTAPDFTLTAYQDGQPRQFSLKSELAKGPVVLYFFPGAFTPGCNVEAQQFAENITEFTDVGVTVVGVTGYAGTTARSSPAEGGLQEAVRDFSKEHCNGKFPVIAADAAMIASYDTASTQRPTLSSRTSYVIGQDGKIAYEHTDPAPDSHITETLAAVHRLHGH